MAGLSAPVRARLQGRTAPRRPCDAFDVPPRPARGHRSIDRGHDRDPGRGTGLGGACPGGRRRRWRWGRYQGPPDQPGLGPVHRRGQHRRPQPPEPLGPGPQPVVPAVGCEQRNGDRHPVLHRARWGNRHRGAPRRRDPGRRPGQRRQPRPDRAGVQPDQQLRRRPVHLFLRVGPDHLVEALRWDHRRVGLHLPDGRLQGSRHRQRARRHPAVRIELP